MKRHGRGKRIWFAVCAVLLLAGVGCGAALRLLSLRLPSQREAERWQGENTREYSQISCFLPLNSTLDVSAVYTFRYAVLDALTAIGFEWDEDVYPFIDAWSCEGKLTITGEKATTDAPVIAVGGQFFEFHPLRLLDGSYISEDDFSFDRVLLDEALAWELFGGTALTGMSVQVNGAELVVGGVLEREQDSASRRAYGEEKGFFMSYETYAAISGKQGIGCYEVVLPETVKGYAAQLVGDKFPLGDGESLARARARSARARGPRRQGGLSLLGERRPHHRERMRRAGRAGHGAAAARRDHRGDRILPPARARTDRPGGDRAAQSEGERRGGRTRPRPEALGEETRGVAFWFSFLSFVFVYQGSLFPKI